MPGEYFKCIISPILMTGHQTRLSYPYSAMGKLRHTDVTQLAHGLEWENWDSNPELSGLYSFHYSVLPTPCNLFQINYALLPLLLLPGRKLFKVSNLNLGTEKDKTTMSGV